MSTKVALIDCSPLKDSLTEIQSTAEFKAFSDTFCNAMREVGFVYLVNHGAEVEEAMAKLLEFFKLPNEIKLKYKTTNPMKSFYGYKAPEDEAANEKDLAKGGELKESFDFCGAEAFDPAKYPAEVPGLQSAIQAYRSSLTKLSQKLLRAFALNLGLDDLDYFVNRHRALEDPSIVSHNAVRSNFYMAVEPAGPIPEDALRMQEHKDWGTLTFLIQDSAGGLEAKSSDGSWIPVTPIQGSIVLNAGLMLEMWSGGYFPATPHRVRLLPESAGKERQSFGFFLQPDGDTNCAPVVPEQADWNPTYPKMTEGQTHLEYFRDRIKSTRL